MNYAFQKFYHYRPPKIRPKTIVLTKLPWLFLHTQLLYMISKLQKLNAATPALISYKSSRVDCVRHQSFHKSCFSKLAWKKTIAMKVAALILVFVASASAAGVCSPDQVSACRLQVPTFAKWRFTSTEG